jgi:hypothetical protein
MSEKFPGGGFESKKEQFPNFKEVWDIFEKVIGDQNYEEVLKIEDEEGLKILEIRIPGEVEDLLIEFTRKSSSSDSSSSIYTSYQDKDGNILLGGEIVARFTEGTWKISSDISSIELY